MTDAKKATDKKAPTDKKKPAGEEAKTQAVAAEIKEAVAAAAEETPAVEPAAPAEEAPAAEPSVPPAEEPAAAADSTEVDEGKVFAVLSYVLTFIFLPFFLVPLIMRNNEFSLYHAKQSLMIWLGIVGTSLINVIPCLGQIVWLIIVVGLLVFNVMGLISAGKGEMKPIPLIGKWGEDWFKGIKKA